MLSVKEVEQQQQIIIIFSMDENIQRMSPVLFVLENFLCSLVQIRVCINTIQVFKANNNT